MWGAGLTAVLVVAAAFGGARLAGQNGAVLLVVGLWVLARSVYSSAVRGRVRTAFAQAWPFIGFLLPAVVFGLAVYRVRPIGVAVAWQQVRALTIWRLAGGALELLAIAAGIVFVAGLLIGLLLRLRRPVTRETVLVALRETGLMAWLVAAWTSAAPAAVFGAVLGGASLLAARLEEEGEGDPRRAPRLMLAALAVVGHLDWLFALALALYAALISGFVYALPGDLSLWLIGFGLAALVVWLGWSLTRSRTWRTVRMNRLSQEYLNAHDNRDAFWRDWFAWRHRRHAGRLHRCLSVMLALLRLAQEALAGRWTPAQAAEPAVKPRVEVFLAGRFAEAAAQVECSARRWEALRLWWRPEGEIDQKIQDSGDELARALDVEARRLWLVADCRFCPSRPCLAPPATSLAEARTLTLDLDLHLRRRIALRAFGWKRKASDSATKETKEASFDVLHGRLGDCFRVLACNKPDWQDVMRFRMALMNNDGVPDDRRRLEISGQVRTWLAQSREDEDYVFLTLIETHVTAHDWAATIEDCRWWELSGRRLTGQMRRLLGESWFHYAFEIHSKADSVLAGFALDQAAGEFFAAGARESLQVVRARVTALARAKTVLQPGAEPQARRAKVVRGPN